MDKAQWAGAADLRERLGPKPRSWLVTATLAYGTLGIIYGDIGTSPLYTLASIFSNVEAVDADDAKMGLSLIFWTLTLVVLFKYVLVVLRADDNGEGGTFALYSRLCRSMGFSPFGTLQQAEHEQLVTMSKKPMPRPSVMSPAQSGGLGRLLSSLQAGGAAPLHPALSASQQQQQLATTSKLGTAPSLKPVPEDAAKADSSPAGTPVGAHQVGIRLPRVGSSTAHDGVAEPELLRAPRWWNKGALPAEPFKRWMRGSAVGQRTLLLISVLATSLMLGDGVLTPAVSVTSAISGLTVATDNVTQDMVVGISCAILVVLFMAQFAGTDKVAFSFSPIVILWLLCNAIIGVYNLARNGAEALEGLNPYWVGAFFQRYGGHTAWKMLGSVMLSVTGSEALFADMGHFSYTSVTISWVCFAYPCLVLTYIGQASHVIVHPDDISTIYWSTVPRSVFYPMLVLATLATVVASQAIISASFSICKQARALGCFPKMQVVNTSDHHYGQVYVPSVNYLLMVLTIAIIAGFNGDGVRLGNAYGLTISAVMLITTFFVVLLAVVDWRLNFALVLAFGAVFGLIDGAFLSSNLTKVETGGWVALAIGGGLGAVNLIWWAGQRRHRRVIARLEQESMASEPFTYVAKEQRDGGGKGGDEVQGLSVASRYARLSGTVINAYDLGLLRGDLALALKHPSGLSTASPLVVMPGVALHYSDDSSSAISAVLRHVMNNQEAMHEVNLLVTVRRLPVPRIGDEDRMLVRTLPLLPNFYQVIARYGYQDTVVFGSDFLQDLIAAVVAVLADGAGIRTIHSLDGADSTVDQDRPVAEGVMDTHSPPLEAFRAPSPALQTVSRGAHLGTTSRGGGAALGTTSRMGTVATVSVGTLTRGFAATATTSPGAVEIQVAGGGDLAARSLGTRSASVPQRLSVDLNTLSRTVQASHLGRLLGQIALLPSKPQVVPPGHDDAVSLLQRLAAVVQSGAAEALSLPPELEEAALRVAALLQAAHNGCVYYFSRTTLRMDPRGNVFRRFLMEHLYKPMLLNSYADHEEWHVPLEHLVEVGMAVRV